MSKKKLYLKANTDSEYIYADSEYIAEFKILYLEENLFNDSQRIIKLFPEEYLVQYLLKYKLPP